jgi:hypothetical protein
MTSTACRTALDAVGTRQRWISCIETNVRFEAPMLCRDCIALRAIVVAFLLGTTVCESAEWEATPRPHCIGVPVHHARVLGVREGPLNTYAAMAAHHFPHGVPLSEIPFVLDLLRAKKAEEVWGRRADVPADQRQKNIPPPLTLRDPLSPAGNHRGPLRGISVAAVPVSMHGKADWDAIALDVRGFDHRGRFVRLRGTLTVTLHGQSQRLVRAFGTQFVGTPGHVERLAVWTRTIEGRQQPLLLSLPRPLPAHDLRRAPLGQVSVRLIAPGRGVFEASSQAIELRKTGPLREQNLLDGRTRFFSGELTHDGRRPTGLRVVNPSAIRPNGRVLTVKP